MRLVGRTSGAPAAIDRYLLPTEQSIITVRQHPVVLAGPIITALAGLAGAAVLAEVVAPGRQALDGFVWIAWGLLLLRAAYKAMNWSIDYFVVTSERLMMVTGIFDRRVAVIPFSLMNDFSLRRSFAGRLIGYGEFIVQYGAGNQVRQRIQYVPYPEQLYPEIRHMLLRGAGAGVLDEADTEVGQET